MNTEIRMNNAIAKVVEYKYATELEHFKENEDNERDNFPRFFMKLQEHILWSVMVMKFNGDFYEIDRWVKTLWCPDRDCKRDCKEEDAAEIKRIRLNFAIEKVVDYLYREEERNFQELLDERDLENSVLFLHKLKQHIFYSVVVLKLKGDAQAINEWVNQYWEENGGEEEEEDEEEEYICDKDGCEEGGSEVFPSGLCYCYKHSIEYEDRINEIKIMSA